MLSLMVWPSLKPRSNLGPWSGFWACFANSHCCFTHLGRQEDKGEEETSCPAFTPSLHLHDQRSRRRFYAAEKDMQAWQLGLNSNPDSDT